MPTEKGVAMNQYVGITKLSTRIGEMERKGLVKVTRETERGNNRFGEPCSYTRYFKVSEA